MIERMPKRRCAYFRDDQIACLVTHQTNEISEDQLRGLLAALKPHLKGGEVDWPPRMISFPAVTAEQYRKWLARLQRVPPVQAEGEEAPGPSPEPLFDAISMLVCNVKNGPKDPLEQIDTIQTLGKQFQEPIAGLTVQSITPNWLISGASQGGATGGPGGLPKPFKTENSDPVQVPYRFEALKTLLNEKGLCGEGENVDVAILDTAPCGHDLVMAYKEWNAHPLINTLLGPDGKLCLYPATYKELLRMGNTSMNRHDYQMTDHGLFAAGIIHSIVPEAKIHLIEVLNPFGVGDLESLTGGLLKVLLDIYKPETNRRLVVNCSWMLELPLVIEHCYAPFPTDPDYGFEQAVWKMIQDDPNPIETKRQAFWLKALCDRLGVLGAQVVAAAGNDWSHAKEEHKAQGGTQKKKNNGQAEEPRGTAPAARYPAALNEVIGVGALPPNSKDSHSGKYRVSEYSNLGDKPAGLGIMTLGGEEGKDNNGKEKGVLGLYLGEKFPGKIPNQAEMTIFGRGNDEKNPWAWWEGTSFATPVLTGTIAAVLSILPDPSSMTQDAVKALYDNSIIERDGTDAKEDVMETVQDY